MAIKHLSEEQIQDYVDRITISNREEIEDHLNSCSICQTNLEAYYQVFSSLKSEKPVELSPDFANKVISSLKPNNGKYWQHLELFFLVLIAIAGIGASFYYLKPVPVLINMGTNALNGMSKIIEMIPVSLNGNFLVISIVLMILVLVEFFDRKLLKTRL